MYYDIHLTVSTIFGETYKLSFSRYAADDAQLEEVINSIKRDYSNRCESINNIYTIEF